MKPVSRRDFLRDAGVGAAAVGVAATVPTFLRKGTKAAITPSKAKAMGRVSHDGPLVAHVMDANSGEITVMVGKKAVSYHSVELAQELARAAQ